MSDFRVGIWNIRNFGADSVSRRGQNAAMTAPIIQTFVRDCRLDVLVILEVMPGALPSLRRLLDELNYLLPNGDDDWCFDWVKGSIGNDPPAGPGDLVWQGGPGSPRREGYAVFFRANRAAFRMVPALLNMSESAWHSARWDPLNGQANFVELSHKGRLFDYADDAHWTAGGGYNPDTDALLPLDALGNALPAWPDSEYPYVNVGWFARPRRTESRRPAFVIANLRNGGDTAARLCPVMGFHAPSNLPRAQMGTYLSGLARELYVVHDLLDNGTQDPERFVHNTNFAAGGDYNANSRNTQQNPENYYGIFTNEFGTIETSGADAESLLAMNRTGPRTTVQINQPAYGHYAGRSIESGDPAAYLFRSIDQAFHRGLIQNGGGVYDLMRKIRQGNTPYQDAILNFGAFFDRIIRDSGRLPDRRQGPLREIGFPEYGLRQGFTNWRAFYGDVNLGHFTTARSAAEFIHMFVSDHLPLVLFFNWP